VKYLVENGRRVISSDTPHGISAEGKEGYPGIEIEKMTALIETLRASGINIKEDGTATGQIDLVAHSEGAIFSILLAYFYPQLVRNLVLENPAGLAGKTNIGIFTMRWLRQMKQQKLKEYKEKAAKPENYLSEVLNRNFSKAIESVSAISAADMREMLKEIKAKGVGVAYITTTEDKFFPSEKLTKGLTGEYADKVYVRDGTHDSTYYRPEEFAGLEDKAIDDLEAKKEKK